MLSCWRARDSEGESDCINQSQQAPEHVSKPCLAKSRDTSPDFQAIKCHEQDQLTYGFWSNKKILIILRILLLGWFVKQWLLTDADRMQGYWGYCRLLQVTEKNFNFFVIKWRGLGNSKRTYGFKSGLVFIRNWHYELPKIRKGQVNKMKKDWRKGTLIMSFSLSKIFVASVCAQYIFNR